MFRAFSVELAVLLCSASQKERHWELWLAIQAMGAIQDDTGKKNIYFSFL